MDNQTTPPVQESIFQNLFDPRPYEKSLKNARTWLYVIAGLYFAVGIYEYFSVEDNIVGAISFGIDAFAGLSFLALALWSKKKPFVAFTIALILYLLIIVTMAFVEPTSIFKGIIFKVLIVIALVKAVSNAKQYEEVKSAIS